MPKEGFAPICKKCSVCASVVFFDLKLQNVSESNFTQETSSETVYLFPACVPKILNVSDVS